MVFGKCRIETELCAVSQAGCLMYTCMDGVVREVNDRVLWKGLELLSVNGGR